MSDCFLVYNAIINCCYNARAKMGEGSVYVPRRYDWWVIVYGDREPIIAMYLVQLMHRVVWSGKEVIGE